ncbi:hypothetical protein J5Y09_09995 [Roseomonas sp. PWR1]|uniref:Uncharacterized protein n=1 Tax=Roseomonas nitratireducens TaxID=2820810 RepID=A0ABS4ASA8_9PROT|nr:hypothetical protein [Neoroseomonas nitratireducens]MBP0464244.1 hypothetical protein [Neoroseomonas nitratireducens]
MSVETEGLSCMRAADAAEPFVAVQVPDADWQDSLVLMLRAAGLPCDGFAAPEDLLLPPFATAPRRVALTMGPRGRLPHAAAPVAALRAAGVAAPVLMLVPGPVEPALACRLLAMGEAEVLENLSATPTVLSALRLLAEGVVQPADAPLSPLARRALGMMLGGRSRRTIAGALAMRLPDLDALVADAVAALAVPGPVALLRAARQKGLLPS